VIRVIVAKAAYLLPSKVAADHRPGDYRDGVAYRCRSTVLAA
jgi:hypothetical protein